MIEAAEQAGDIELALQGRNFRILGLLEQPDMAAAERELNDVSTIAEQLRQPLFRYRVASRRAMLALMRGQFTEAEHLAMEANTISERAEDANAPHQFAAQMMALRREDGRLAELEPVAAAFVDQNPHLPGWRCALAYLYSELERTDETRANLEVLAPDNFRALPLDVNWTAALTLLADACAFLGDRAYAQSLYDLLLPHEKEHIVIAAGAVSQGSSSHYLGLLATVLARFDNAEKHFDDAIDMHDALDAQPLSARTQLAKGTMLLAAGDAWRRDEAVELLGQAREAARSLKMVTLLRRADAVATRAGTDGRKARRSPKTN
jgi:tetratricopeptide (TPR) repeat protein